MQTETRELQHQVVRVNLFYDSGSRQQSCLFVNVTDHTSRTESTLLHTQLIGQDEDRFLSTLCSTPPLHKASHHHHMAITRSLPLCVRHGPSDFAEFALKPRFLAGPPTNQRVLIYMEPGRAGLAQSEGFDWRQVSI
jgi:hypothetical protein